MTMTVNQLIEKLAALSEEEKNLPIYTLNYEGNEEPINQVEVWKQELPNVVILDYIQW